MRTAAPLVPLVGSSARFIVRAQLIVVLTLSMGCSGIIAPEEGSRDSTAAVPFAPTSPAGDVQTTTFPLGVVTGGFYTDFPQPLRTHAEAVFCELKSAGARWIRIEADWANTSAE